MALLGIENMPFYTCLNLGVNKSFPVYAYIIVLETAALYNHTIHCKDSTLNLSIFASQIMHLCICLCYGLYVCFHTYAHIVVCKDTCLQIYIYGTQKCSYIYASIRVSKDAPWYMPIYEFSKMPILYSARMTLSIYLYLHVKWCKSLYVYVRFSIYASIYAHIVVFKYTDSKFTLCDS